MVRKNSHAHRHFVLDGFTLIELLVVLAIIATLLSLSLPRYFSSIDRSKEAVLRENLRTTRETIDKFYGDRGRYPDSLQELVDEHYLRSIPFDPITGKNDSWQTISPSGRNKGQLFDIKSGAPGSSLDGKAYSEF